ncbi:MAG: sialidase family protein, partial [Mycobacteriales bacterium]
LYYCTNTAQVGGLLFPAGVRLCYRSLDGGMAWDAGRVLLQKPASHFPQCQGVGEQFDSLDGYYPTADAQGRLYLIIRCGPTTESIGVDAPPSTAYVLRSDDEMATWHQVGVAPALPTGYGLAGKGPFKEELRADHDGNLYLVRGTQGPSDGLYLTVSGDRGVTWTAPRKMLVPGTHLAASPTWQVAVGSPGHAAVAYAGSSSAPPCAPSSSSCGDLSMYLVETSNALSPAPVFRGAALNGPGDRTAYQLAGKDFTDVTIGPDAVARAVFPGGYVGWLGR